MIQVKILYDETVNTLTIWLDDAKNEYVCEETGDEVILMKDKTSRVIGFQKLNFTKIKSKHLQVVFETIAA